MFVGKARPNQQNGAATKKLSHGFSPMIWISELMALGIVMRPAEPQR